MHTIVERLHTRWRQLKNETGDHSVTCPCKNCKERRQLARDLNLPHVGRIDVRKLRLRIAA
jgi:hypothetical protein